MSVLDKKMKTPRKAQKNASFNLPPEFQKLSNEEQHQISH